MEIRGWNRTFLLGLGAFAGVMITAYLIHLYKGGKGASMSEVRKVV